MQAHHTPSDQRYPDTFTSTAFWAPGGSDSSQPAVTRDADDRHGPPRLRANQLSSFGLTQRDSYPTQTQSDCPGQYPYPSQHYIPTVNYTAPPFDLAEYPIVPGSTAYHSGQYLTQTSSTVARYDYPPSDPTPFQPTTYEPTGYFSADGHYGLPLDGQRQQSLVSDPSGYLRYDDSFEHFRTVTQHAPMPIPPSSTSSELGNALLEPQQMGRASIALPGLPLPPQIATKHDSSENSVKTEYGATASGQPFSPMTPLESQSFAGDHAPYIKKEEQEEQLHVGNSSMPRRRSSLHGSHPHRPHALDSFRVVQDPTAYPEFATPTKRHPPPQTLAIPGLLSYSPRISTPVSSSFSPSDVGTPTSSLMDTTTASSSLPAATLVPNQKAGQGVLKLPSTKRSARRKPAIACLFCRERKIACGAPPVGSADPTCNQCARRSRKCEYPTMSRRGLHKRRDNGGAHHRESEDADYVPTS